MRGGRALGLEVRHAAQAPRMAQPGFAEVTRQHAEDHGESDKGEQSHHGSNFL